jgi:hypothetical protein
MTEVKERNVSKPASCLPLAAAEKALTGAAQKRNR